MTRLVRTGELRYKVRMAKHTLSLFLFALLGCSSQAGQNGQHGKSAPDLSSPQGQQGGAPGCAGTKMLPLPADPAADGPYPVGARTVTIGRLTTEVFYPAKAGSETGMTKVVYDIRQHLPASQQQKIPDDKNPWQPCNCYRDLPVDEQHGPYPVVLFIHGTAGFRTQSLSHLTHFASRGFVVIAADHPGLMLADILAPFCGVMPGKLDLAGDVDAELGEFGKSGGALSFVSALVDLTRIGFVGHSAGGAAVAELGDRPGVQVVVPWSAGTKISQGPDLRTSLFVGGESDRVVPFSAVQSGYAASPPPTQLVGIDKAGHLVVTELCSLHNQQGQDILTVAQQAGVCGASLAGLLFDCSSSYLPDSIARPLVDHATSTVLDGVLLCGAQIPAGLSGLDGLQARYPDVTVFKQQLK
jgi:pimeloyl-ACP methyl ester carboxylesterase